MKTLIYKGFGRDGKGEVKFDISIIDENYTSKIFVEAFTSDQRVTNEGSDEEGINLRVVSQIWETQFWPLYLAEDYLSLEEWRDIDSHDQSLVKKNFRFMRKALTACRSPSKKLNP